MGLDPPPFLAHHAPVSLARLFSLPAFLAVCFLLGLVGVSFAGVAAPEEETCHERSLEAGALENAPTAQARRREAQVASPVRAGPGRHSTRSCTPPRPRQWQNGPCQPLRN